MLKHTSKELFRVFLLGQWFTGPYCDLCYVIWPAFRRMKGTSPIPAMPNGPEMISKGISRGRRPYVSPAMSEMPVMFNQYAFFRVLTFMTQHHAFITGTWITWRAAASWTSLNSRHASKGISPPPRCMLIKKKVDCWECWEYAGNWGALAAWMFVDQLMFVYVGMTGSRADKPEFRYLTVPCRVYRSLAD